MTKNKKSGFWHKKTTEKSSGINALDWLRE